MDFRAIFWMYLLRNAGFLAVVLFFYISESPLDKNMAVIWYSLVLLPGIVAAVYIKHMTGQDGAEYSFAEGVPALQEICVG